ncbi:MAG: arginine--tRNA ligase, partial [Oscillospiraceae bacterium]|nr:arginine--tRNA ligase [Oscillospiraceae bacterium]
MQKDYTCYNPRQAALDQARALLTKAAQAAIAAGTLPEAPLPDFIVEIPADPKNGDVASNLAMAGARAFRKAPRMIAEAIAAQADLTGTGFEKLEIAGPGFMNLYQAPQFYADVVLAACSNPEYGRTNYGAGKKYNVEFVSANPTGPMHLGNARGGALGDCLAAVLDWSGHEVCREFYINDAGNQIQKFGKSLAVRYLQLQAGEEAFPLPEDCYQGADILAHAQNFNAEHPGEYAPQTEACKALSQEELYTSEAFEALKNALVGYALPKNIAALETDLAKYRIKYDVWFRESTLHDSGS